jgi:hypothetical protein
MNRASGFFSAFLITAILVLGFYIHSNWDTVNTVVSELQHRNQAVVALIDKLS